MHPFKACFCLALHISALASIAAAAPSAIESFNYPFGATLNGQLGGGSQGFSGAWSGNSTFTIGSGSLNPPAGATSDTGNRSTTTAFGANRDVERFLSNPLGTPGTSTYFSFSMQPEGTLNQGFANGWFGFFLRGGAQVGVTKDSFSNFYALELAGTTAYTNTQAVVGQPAFFVLRIDWTSGTDTLRLYVNPAIGLPEPLVADAMLAFGDTVSANRVVLSGPGAYSFDALRGGSTFQDVMPAPVPEPSGMVLLLIGLTSLGIRHTWHRRRASRNCV